MVKANKVVNELTKKNIRTFHVSIDLIVALNKQLLKNYKLIYSVYLYLSVHMLYGGILTSSL